MFLGVGGEGFERREGKGKGEKRERKKKRGGYLAIFLGLMVWGVFFGFFFGGWERGGGGR